MDAGIVIGSNLVAVTVHARGAVCTRHAQVSLPDGAAGALAQVEVRGLPLSLEPGSLRARVVEGPPGLELTAVRPGFHAELSDQVDVAAEQQLLEAAQLELQRVDAERARVGAQVQAWQKLKPVAPKAADGAGPPRLAAEALIGFARFAEAELSVLHARAFELQRRWEDARAEVTLRQRRIQESSAQLATRRTRVERVAVLAVRSAGPVGGPLTVAVEYVVRGARWLPGYTLELEPGLASGRLRMRAHLVQQTGEDWGAVRLALSTASLDRRSEVPALTSLRIGKRQEPPRSGWRPPPPGLDELFGPWEAARGRLAPRGGVRADAVELVQALAAPADELDQPAEDAEEELAMELSAPMAAPASFALAGPAPAPSSRAQGAPAAMPVMAKRSAAPMRALSARPKGGAGGGRGRQEAPKLDALEAPVGPDDALLDYGALVLAGPEERGRGRLHPRPGAKVFLGARVSVQVDVMVAAAIGAGEQVHNLPAPAHAADVRASAGAFDYRYDAPGPVDLPSDGRWQMVPAGEAQIALRPEFVCVPALDPHVFRTLELHNLSAHALLEGPADVRVGGAFLMTVPFPTLAPQGRAQVGLGVEESIQVARNTRFEEAAGGLLGGAAVLSHEVSIEVVNRLPAPARLRIRERLPVPGEKDVKVEPQEVKPPWEKDPAPDGPPVEGAHAWRFELPPGQTRHLLARYDVRIPASKVVVGGNRRT